MPKYDDPLLRKDSKGVFNLYLNRNDVGEKMLTSFLNQAANKTENGFVFSADDINVGILSQCYGILTLCEYSKYDLDLGKYPAAIAKINKSLAYIFDHVQVDSDFLVFGATPYVKSTEEVKTYVETAAVFLQIVIEIRRMLYIDLDLGRNTIEIDAKHLTLSGQETEEERTQIEISFVEKLIVRSFDIITGAALKIDGENGVDYRLRGSSEPLFDSYHQKMIYKGWTFTAVPPEKHDRTDISLYFTYLVADAYFTFFENFENALKAVRSLRDKIMAAGSRLTVEEACPEDYEISLEDMDEKTRRDFIFLKNNFSSYYRFSKTMLDAGHYVDSKMATVDTTKDFINHNFNLVTEQDIEESSANDALFNVLFTINIMMSSGVDLDYAAAGKGIDFYDILQYTVPNVQRLYKRLVREGKDYICDQYTLKFNEALPNDGTEAVDSVFNQARLLRKQHIVAANIIPLMIKTYNILSKYLTPYPQYEMRVYKDTIIANKMEGEWVWDSDGFQLINNYNYVFSLRNFYDYYEKYERPYALDKLKYIEEKNEEIAKLKEEQKRKLQAKEKSYTEELNLRKEEQEKQVEELQRRISDLEMKKAPIEEEIERILDRSLEKSLTKTLNEIIRANGRVIDESEDLTTVFKRAVTSYFTEQCSEVLSVFSEIDEEKKEAFRLAYKDLDHYAETIVFSSLGEVVSERIKAEKE